MKLFILVDILPDLRFEFLKGLIFEVLNFELTFMHVYLYCSELPVEDKSGKKSEYIALPCEFSCKLRRYIFQKHEIFPVLTTKCFFIKQMNTFGHIVVCTFYTSHIDHFTPQHTAFEQSAACLSVYLELLPGLIPFAIL